MVYDYAALAAQESALREAAATEAKRAKEQQQKADADAKQKEEDEKAQAKGAKEETAKRLAARKFISISGDALVSTILFNANGEELWDKNYASRYVRWPAKFIETNILSDFSANVGDSVLVDCRLDESQQKADLDKFAKWKPITVEGKLAGITKPSGEQRANVTLKECIVK